MDQALFLGLFRHVLQIAAGYFVGKGVIDGEMANTAIGALVSLGTVGWFAWDKAKAKK